MNPECQVLPIASGQEAEWLRLRLALWPEDPADVHGEQMEEILRSDQQTAIGLSRPDGGLAGFVEGSFHPHAIGYRTHPVGYVEGWYVEADLRGRGWGSRLIRALEDWARARGAREMASDTQLDNEFSLAAHLRLGYAESGRLIHFSKRL